MNGISTSSPFPIFDPTIHDPEGGGTTTGPRGPLHGAGDGVETSALEPGGTIICPDGTHPTTVTEGQTVTVDCVDDKPKKGGGKKKG
jgi:hypothetical protein